MFKHTFIASLLAMGLATPIMANDNGSLYSYQIGYSRNSVQSGNTGSADTAGAYMGIDFMKVGNSGLGIGVGFDINALDGSGKGASGGSAEYTISANAKIGYTFQNRFNIPLKLKAGVGYGYMENVLDSGWGTHYEGGAEYLLYKNLGVGAKYKYAEADMMGTTLKNDSVIYYMMFGY